MLGKTRPKRGDLFDEITFNDSSDEEEEEKKKPKQVPPPPSMLPLEPPKVEKNNTKGPTKEVIPPPSVIPLMPSPKKPEVIDDRMKLVTFPTDEEEKTGNKYYIVYKKLSDAYYYSPELPQNFNNFCKTAFNSIKFTFDSTNNRYEVDFDSEYIRAIHLSSGFSRVLGFNEVIFKGGIAPNPPAIETFHSHILVCLKDIIYPISFGSFHAPLLGVIPVSAGPDPVSVIYAQPNYSTLVK
uniref:Uncharacterized protein n=1 Tax=Panagrolaimus davidi TaxID=227884 RepID=A0A914QV03_9BILA